MRRLTPVLIQLFWVILILDLAFMIPENQAQSAEAEESERTYGKAEAGEKEKTLEEVVVSGRQPLYKKFPGTVNVVSEGEINNIKPTDVTDVIRRVPGVNYSDEDGNGLRPDIGIRGLDPIRSRNVLLLADGFPVQPSLYGDPGAYYNVPVETVDHIEVIKGGAALLYGATSVGGVINYITKKPSEKPFEITNKETGGSNGFYSSVTNVGGTRGPLSYSGTYVTRQGDGFRENNGFGIHDVNTYLGYKIDDHSELISRSYLYYENSETPGGLTRAQYNANPKQTQFPDDTFNARRASTNLTYLNRLDENQSLESYLNYNFFRRDWFLTGAKSNITNNQVKRDFNVFSFGGKYHLDYDLLGMEGNSFTFGNDYYFDKEDDTRDIGASRTARIGTRDTDNDLTTFAFAFYGVTDLRLTDRFTLSPILRVDRVRSGLENNISQKEGETTTVALLYGIGADYKIGDTTHLYASFHKSFKPPEFRQAVNPTTGTPNDLNAQNGLHYEVGLKSQPVKWLSYDLAAFLFDFDNQIVTVGSALVNGQTTRHVGLEGATSLDLVSMTERFSGLDVPDGLGTISTNFNFTLISTEFRTGSNIGKELPYAPHLHLNGSVNYNHPTGYFANLGAEWVSAQFADSKNTQVESADGSNGLIPNYAVWYTNIGKKFNDRFDVFVSVKNLFDEKYFSRRDSGSFIGIIPAPDRQFFGGVTIKF